MAELTSASINDLPDSAFAYIEPGDEKDSEGKTTPRSLRHFPIHDEAHVRNALARLDQSPFGDKARAKVEAAARKFGIGEPAGKATELKAEPMDTGRLDRWLAGKISRRILVAPFYGPLPAERFGYSDSKGRDLDGEFFHPDTDFYGPFPSLRRSRERLTDWHHVTFDANKDPAGGRMKGAILGHIVMDEDPESDGLWADFWANAGEKRRNLVAALEKRSVPMFASTQPVKAGIVRGEAGALDVWPIRYNTISTSPQNTYAVMPSLKAALTDPNFDEIPADAVKAFLTGLDSAGLELLTGSLETAVQASDSGGSDVVKAGRVLSAANETRLRALLGQLTETLDEMVRREIAEMETPTQ